MAGRRIAYFTTAPEDAHEVLANTCAPSTKRRSSRVSGNLARRDALREDIDRLDADTYVVEIKAAAIDVVAEEASKRGVELVFADNDVLPLPGEPDLDERAEEPRRRSMTSAATRSPCPLGGDDGLPYSKGLMARALMATGVGAVAAYELARRIELDLDSSGCSSTTLERVEELAVRVAGEGGRGQRDQAAAPATATSRRSTCRSSCSIGGATGTGKSTVATEVGAPTRHHTRHVDRLHPPDDARVLLSGVHAVHPLLELRGRRRRCRRGPDPLLNGFLEQTRNVLVGVRAAIDRAMHEGWSMVLEGVHLVPGLVPASVEGALVIPCVLAIEDRREHATHFCGPRRARGRPRAGEVPASTSTTFVRFRRISWSGHTKNGVPVIENVGMQQAVTAVIELVLERAAEVQQRV